MASRKKSAGIRNNAEGKNKRSAALRNNAEEKNKRSAKTPNSPYQKGDVLQVKIEDIGNDGEGIGKVDGYTLFVKDAVIGDLAEVSIMKSKKNYAYAHLDKVLEPSPYRIDPPCPVSKACGGCQIQNISYEKQLEFKAEKVRNNIIRLGGFEADFVDSVMEPIIGMEPDMPDSVKEIIADIGPDMPGSVKKSVTGMKPDFAGSEKNSVEKTESSSFETSKIIPAPFRYRNKAQFPIGTGKDGQPIAGFYAGRTHAIIPMEDCLLGVTENKDILNAVIDHMKKYHIPAYDEQTGKGLFRHVLIRKGFHSGQIMVCLVINTSNNQGREGAFTQYSNVKNSSNSQKGESRIYFQEQQELIGKLSEIPGVKSITVNINNEKTNVILGNEIHTIYGDDSIEDTLCGIKFRISPLSFYQVNPVQTERLYNTAVEYANLTGKETVWDLYCGIGTITLSMSRKAKHVYGVEVIPQAIDNARENATANGITNATFYVGKAEEVLPAFYNGELTKDRAEDSEKALHPDVIVVDPPRKGCDSACLETMLKMAPERIVYVSCDSATLARDLRILADGGYSIKHIRPVDMFPHTVHVESVCLLERMNKRKPDTSINLSLDMEEYYDIIEKETINRQNN